jgi:hypothetical protein
LIREDAAVQPLLRKPEKTPDITKRVARIAPIKLRDRTLQPE